MACEDSIHGDAKINCGQRMYSANRALELVMQHDGNLVLYRRKDLHPLWATGTNGQGGQHAIMQKDGNLVVYAAGHRPIWASQTHGKHGCRLVLQNDANLVIYDCNNTPVWASGTHGQCPDCQDSLKPGEKLLPGRSIHSKNGQCDLIMQTDGNLVLYRTRDGSPVWSSNTCGQNVREAIMQDDGNFVIYDVYGRAIFASGTHGHHGADIIMQDDGNLCIYKHGKCLWDSHTWGKCC